MDTALGKLIQGYPVKFIDCILQGFETDHIEPEYPEAAFLTLDAALELHETYQLPASLKGELLYKKAAKYGHSKQVEKFIAATEEALAFNDALSPDDDTCYGRCNIRVWLAQRYLELGLHDAAAVLLAEALDYQAEHPGYHVDDCCLGWGALEAYAEATGEKLPDWKSYSVQNYSVRQWAKQWKAYRASTAAQIGGGI